MSACLASESHHGPVLVAFFLCRYRGTFHTMATVIKEEGRKRGMIGLMLIALASVSPLRPLLLACDSFSAGNGGVFLDWFGFGCRPLCVLFNRAIVNTAGSIPIGL